VLHGVNKGSVIIPSITRPCGHFLSFMFSCEVFVSFTSLYLCFPYRCVISNSGVIHCPTQHVEC
jgi:hypothetical protein